MYFSLTYCIAMGSNQNSAYVVVSRIIVDPGMDAQITEEMVIFTDDGVETAGLGLVSVQRVNVIPKTLR